MKQRIYIDTSVIGGYYDAPLQEATRQLFERIADGEFDVYFSEVNDAELMNAPQRVKEVKGHLFKILHHTFELKSIN